VDPTGIGRAGHGAADGMGWQVGSPNRDQRALHGLQVEGEPDG
jgi:hypothetical protein